MSGSASIERAGASHAVERGELRVPKTTRQAIEALQPLLGGCRLRLDEAVALRMLIEQAHRSGTR